MLLLWRQVLIPKLKDPDPNPGVVISVLAAIGEQAAVSGVEMRKWMDELLPTILDMLQDSSSLQKREVRHCRPGYCGGGGGCTQHCFLRHSSVHMNDTCRQLKDLLSVTLLNKHECVPAGGAVDARSTG